MATAAPVLVFEIKYNETNEKPMTRVFVAPNKTKNPLLSVFEIVLPMIAAWPLPNPGRKLQRGEAMIAPKRGLRIFIFGFAIICFGIFGLFFIVNIKLDAPKSPVNNGRRG